MPHRAAPRFATKTSRRGETGERCVLLLPVNIDRHRLATHGVPQSPFHGRRDAAAGDGVGEFDEAAFTVALPQGSAESVFVARVMDDRLSEAVDIGQLWRQFVALSVESGSQQSGTDAVLSSEVHGNLNAGAAVLVLQGDDLSDEPRLSGERLPAIREGHDRGESKERRHRDIEDVPEIVDRDAELVLLGVEFSAEEPAEHDEGLGGV